MPSKAKASPPPPDYLAEAQAAWADIKPRPQVALRPGVDHTVTTFMAAEKLSRSRAQSLLAAQLDAGKLHCAVYRLPGERQPQNVYWPAGVPAPDDEPGPSAP